MGGDFESSTHCKTPGVSTRIQTALVCLNYNQRERCSVDPIWLDQIPFNSLTLILHPSDYQFFAGNEITVPSVRCVTVVEELPYQPQNY